MLNKISNFILFFIGLLFLAPPCFANEEVDPCEKILSEGTPTKSSKHLFKDYCIYVPNYLIPNICRKILAQTNSLLDIGTGSGRELPLLAMRLPPQGKITALDISEEALTLAQAQLDILSHLFSSVDHLTPEELQGLRIALEGFNFRFDPSKIRLVRATALDLPFPDNSFEVVILNDVLLHFDSAALKIVLEEAKRVATQFVIFTNYPQKEEGEAVLPGNTSMLSLADLYWQLALDLWNRGVNVSEVILNPYDLKASYAHFHQLLRNSIDLGYFFKKVSTLLDEKEKARLIKKYFLRSEGYFFLHTPEDLLTILGGTASVETYSGGEMFSAERNLIIWQKIK